VQYLFSCFLVIKKGYVACSVEFGDTLLAVGATAHTVLYKDKTHTDLILQVCESLLISLVRNSINPILGEINILLNCLSIFLIFI